jgi:streptogramin lyase
MSDPDPRLRESLDRRAKRFAPSGGMDRLLARARRRQRNRRVAAGAVALSVFAGVAGGLWLVASGRDPRPAPTAEEPLVTSVRGAVLGMAVDRNAVWVPIQSDEPGDMGGEVLRVDPASGRVVARIPFRSLDAIAAGEGGVWFTDGIGRTLWRIDPASNEAIEVSRLPAPRSDEGAIPPRNRLATGFGRVWVFQGGRGVYSVDPASGDIVTEHGPLVVEEGDPHLGPRLAAGEGGVWVSTAASQILRLDAETGQSLFEVEVPFRPFDLEVGLGGVWLAGEGVVRRIDADRIEVGPALPAGATIGPLVVTLGGVFAGDEEGRVVRVDPGGGDPETVYKTGTPIAGIEAGDGVLWVLTGTRLVRVPAPDVVPLPPPGEEDAAVPEGADVCAYPRYLPTYLPWLQPGQSVPEPTRSISAAGGGPQGLDPGYSILHWGSPFGDVTREGGPELEGYVSLWRTTEPTGVLQADPDVPPLPDGSEGKVFGPGPGRDDLSIHWADPTPSPYDDDCSETTLVLHMPNVSLDRLRTELLLVAASIGGGPAPQADAGFAVWTVDTPEEAEREAEALAGAPDPVFLEDPEETAITFVRELLEWPDALVERSRDVTRPYQHSGAPAFEYRILREPAGPEIRVVVAQVIGDRWWAVTRASTPNSEVNVGVEGGVATVSFPRYGAAVVEARLGYGAGDNIEHVEEAAGIITELTFNLGQLGFDSSRPGHLLLLYRDDSGSVFRAMAIALGPES